jgi:hypothetical protein
VPREGGSSRGAREVPERRSSPKEVPAESKRGQRDRLQKPASPAWFTHFEEIVG